MAAACNGVQHSLSRALTWAPASRSCCTISRKSSMQLCGAPSLSVRAHAAASASPPTTSGADLMQGRQAILIGQIRADPALEKLADCGEDRGGQGLGAEVGCRPISPAQAPAQGTWVACYSQDSRGAQGRHEGPQSPGRGQRLRVLPDPRALRVGGQAWSISDMYAKPRMRRLVAGEPPPRWEAQL